MFWIVSILSIYILSVIRVNLNSINVNIAARFGHRTQSDFYIRIAFVSIKIYPDFLPSLIVTVAAVTCQS